MNHKEKRDAKPTGRAEQRLRLRIICVAPPLPEEYGAEFGLQDNCTTAAWVIHAGETRANGDLHFACECRVRPHQKTQAPSFLGEFVHGDAAQRFLYLSWRPKNWKPGTQEPSTPIWVRRIKVHLRAITWAQIDEAVKIGGVLEATVLGRARDGGPNCASVPLVGGGWAVRKS